MPESRDRLVRPVDLGAAFARIRDSALADEPEQQLIPSFGTGWNRAGIGTGSLWNPRTGNGRGRTVLGVLADEEETQFTPPVGRGWGRGGWTPITVHRRGRNLHGTPVAGIENTPMTGTVARGRGRGRPTNNLLPAWYPRTPLQDITHITRAMQRRRSRLGETERQQNDGQEQTTLETPLPQRQRATPSSSVQKKKKPCPPSMRKISKILQTVAHKPSPDDSEFMTPEKKLLAEIHTVEKVVMDELNKLKRTPTAKRAERKKKHLAEGLGLDRFEILPGNTTLLKVLA